jgi:hypothetical protein
MIRNYPAGQKFDPKMINQLMEYITTPIERASVCVNGSQGRGKLAPLKHSFIIGKHNILSATNFTDFKSLHLHLHQTLFLDYYRYRLSKEKLDNSEFDERFKKINRFIKNKLDSSRPKKVKTSKKNDTGSRVEEENEI